MTKIIGLTGPTGAGKSVTAEVFASLGAKVIDCDQLAKEVTGRPDCIQALCKAFGCDIMENGFLNRKKLADRAFCCAASTAMLNEITHPIIIQELKRQIDVYKQENVDSIVIDAPLLFEGGLESYCDFTVAVVADPQIRKMRIIKRDHITDEQAVARMAAQKDNNYYVEHCRYTIMNDGSERENREAAARIYARIMSEE